MAWESRGEPIPQEEDFQTLALAGRTRPPHATASYHLARRQESERRRRCLQGNGVDSQYRGVLTCESLPSPVPRYLQANAVGQQPCNAAPESHGVGLAEPFQLGATDERERLRMAVGAVARGVGMRLCEPDDHVPLAPYNQHFKVADGQAAARVTTWSSRILQLRVCACRRERREALQQALVQVALGNKSQIQQTHHGLGGRLSSEQLGLGILSDTLTDARPAVCKRSGSLPGQQHAGEDESRVETCPQDE